jgi:hypothetical protein
VSLRMRRRLPLALATCFGSIVLLSPLASSELDARSRIFVAAAALAGAAALAFFLARLVDRRAAAYGVLALSTMPLYFVAARTTPGDAAAMAASSVAVAGLGVAVFDRRRGESRGARLASLVLGLVGLIAGALAHGALLGVAVPALAVGLAWILLARPRIPGSPGSLADACGALALVIGGAAVAVAARAGLALTGAGHAPFDAVLHRLGHTLFPWSGLLPLACIALLSPPARRGPLASAREEAGRTVVLMGGVVAFGAHAIGDGGAGAVPFTAPAIVAAALALAAWDLDRPSPTDLHDGLRGAAAARAATISAALLTALLARDLFDVPERALASIAPLHAGSPLVTKGTWVAAAALVVASVPVLVAFDRARPAAPRRAAYLAWPRALVTLWGGHLATGLCAVQATLTSLALAVVLRPGRPAPLGALPRSVVLHASWVFPLAILAVAWVPLGARDALHALRLRARLSRGDLVMGCGALAGALLAWAHYPALLAAREAQPRGAEIHVPAAARGSHDAGERTEGGPIHVR